ncbi:hypothetical protein D3C84_1181930 [compost metagenome]
MINPLMEQINMNGFFQQNQHMIPNRRTQKGTVQNFLSNILNGKQMLKLRAFLQLEQE